MEQYNIHPDFLKYKITPLPLIEDRDYRTITGFAR